MTLLLLKICLEYCDPELQAFFAEHRMSYGCGLADKVHVMKTGLFGRIPTGFTAGQGHGMRVVIALYQFVGMDRKWEDGTYMLMVKDVDVAHSQ